MQIHPLRHKRIQPTRTKNPQFLSFLEESRFRQVNADRYEVSMRRRRIFGMVFGFVVILGFAWVVVESARALSIF